MARSRRTLHAALQDSVTPPDALTPTQSLARVVQAEGNGLYTCALPGGNGDDGGDGQTAQMAQTAQTAQTVLVELNARFRNTVFMRRGGYVLVDLATAAESRQAGRRVVGEIVNVVRDEKAWRKQPYWPAAFAAVAQHHGGDDNDDDDEEESTMGKMPPSDSDEE